MTVKTIRRHIDAGRLRCRDIGTGTERVRRGFLLADIEAFYRAIKRGGQSDDTTLSALVYELQRERGSQKPSEA